MTIPVVDLFAGPGGLGEGFSALRERGRPVFKIAISAEMEERAHETLRLRAFFRQFPDGEVPQSYYDYVAGGGSQRGAGQPWTARSQQAWLAACEEAQRLEIGEPAHDIRLRERVKKIADSGEPWVLVGGPPCQAYSLVGRSRNAGTKGYRAEDDPRFFLYRHYRDIVGKYQPAAFVMENVRGLLSAKVEGGRIFPRILEEMHHPRRGSQRYTIIPLVANGRGASPTEERDYLIRSELYGIPQARHRVILLGLAEGIPLPPKLLEQTARSPSFADALRGLPRLRSGVTDAEIGRWPKFARDLLRETAHDVATGDPAVAKRLRALATEVGAGTDPGRGANSIPATASTASGCPELDAWLLDRRLEHHLNHHTREHMQTDLMRYTFAAAFAQVHGRSPKGHREFPRPLWPAHKNWKTGKFLDRFKVQLPDNVSSTVTSHIAKDGHYFIHPDVSQVRSLTVREAARLQTFPDNYFFEGSRGAQYRQVGNAVPPLLANKIAAVVASALRA